MNLKGKTILITGGASGIGLESAKQFLALGANVIITGRNKEKLDQAKKLYPQLTAIQNDVSNPDDALKLYHIAESLGGIDILYNNAGVSNPTNNLAKANDKITEMAAYEMDINYISVVRLNNLFLKMLQNRPEAAIINTTSILSYVPSNLAPTYSATKAALRFYTASLRNHLEVAKSNIKVFELLPPLVATEMAKGIDAKTITPETLVKALLDGIQKNKFTIRVGDTKVVYFLSRFFPKTAYKLINPVKNSIKLSA
ncbi:SDR family oxidoreductase [Flavobacterium panacagri]|uniref:SDR family oxidoreductase n=1 Tax=Flavobacterium panacagri TaxID=3034146 RepID=UPI0025A67A32|nr:SDR family NAD(P)-dependent oxidoreductase [Flavobacterium panacagri]